MSTETATTSTLPETRTLSLEIEDGIGTLTVDRPDALNAIDPEMVGEPCGTGSPTRWDRGPAKRRRRVLRRGKPTFNGR